MSRGLEINTFFLAEWKDVGPEVRSWKLVENIEVNGAIATGPQSLVSP